MKRNELQSSIALAAQVATPNLNTISHILKHDFGIQFRRLDGAQSKYLDPYFDEKRLWASRLLVQFHIQNALIISIDESNFRHDTLKNFSW